MSQSNGYKRFRSSIKMINQATSTPQTTKRTETTIFPRASTPNPNPLNFYDQPTVPVAPIVSPRPHPKIVRKRRQHRSKHHQFQIYVDQIIFIGREKTLCSNCQCKKRRSQRVIGVL